MIPCFGDWHCVVCRGLFCPLAPEAHFYRGWTLAVLAPGDPASSQPGWYTMVARQNTSGTMLEVGMLTPGHRQGYRAALARLRAEIDGGGPQHGK